MKFENYELVDFLMDESFYNCVINYNCEDGKFWESWLVDHPDKMNDADQAKKILKTISFKDKGFDKQKITDLWEKIKSESIEEASPVAEVRNINYWKYIKVAAVILPFAIAAVMFLIFHEAPGENRIAEQILIEKSNPKGEKRTVFLSDGSRVKLNAESKLIFLNPFDDHERVIHLEGEAFFEVAPDSKRPFIVKSGNLETTVLGTSFNVLAYPQDNNIVIAVRSGKVAVKDVKLKTQNDHNSNILLSPQEMAVYSKKEHVTVVSDFDPLKTFGWSEGTLFFDNACIGEFEKKLERWYGVDIVIQRNQPIAKGITGVFKNQSLEEILMGTKDASEFNYEFLSNGKVLIN